jgi:hypothetical protein
MSDLKNRLFVSFQPWILALIGLALAGNLLAAFAIGILPDEAYYWVWSQRPELSYFDHPPLIAWLESITTLLFGNTLFAVRLPAILSWLVGAIFAYRLAQVLFSARAGVLAVLVWTSLPIVQVGFHLATPDSALIIFTWLTVWFAWRAGSEESPTLWLVTGVLAGLTMVGKYPGVVVIGTLFFALLSSRQGRRQLQTPWPWLAAVLAVLVFSPVVIWNAQHDWLSFAFQFGHGVKAHGSADSWTLFLFFLGGQVFAAMPWTLFGMIYFSAGMFRDREIHSGYGLALLAWGFWLPLIVFGLAGLTSKSGPNWPETAYVTGTVILAGGLDKWLFPAGQQARGRVAGVALLFLFSVFIVNMLRFPQWIQYVAGEDFTPKRTQLSQSYGWDKLKPELQRLLVDAPPGCRILVDNHARAGMVAWLLDLPMRVTTTEESRFSQYNVWRAEDSGKHNYCLYIDQYDDEFDERSDIPQRVSLQEGEFEQVMVVTADNPDLSLRWFSIYRPVSR